MLSLSQTTAPTVEPVTIQQAKAHLRVPFDEDNLYIETLIKAARKRIEETTHLQSINASWTYNLDTFPGTDAILLPLSPVTSVTSVTSVKYYDTGSTQQTVSTNVYNVDTATIVPKIFLKYNQTWPSDARGGTNDVTIIFVAGYGTTPTEVPEVTQQAILMLVSHWYENREPVVVGTTASPIPMTIDALLSAVEVPFVA